MVFEQHEFGGQQSLTFVSRSEVMVVSAVYLEYIGQSIMRGNISSLESRDYTFASWRGEKHTMLVSSYLTVTDRFEAFADGTEEALEEIARSAHKPAYCNDAIIDRRLLGTRAQELSDEIATKAEEHLMSAGQEEVQNFIDEVLKPRNDPK